MIIPGIQQGDLHRTDLSTRRRLGSRKPMSRTNSSVRSPFAGRPKKTKQWDHTAFAKYGWKKPKGKGKASFDDGEDEEEDVDEPVEFEQFPAPSAAVK